jgi:hypothetical protein
MSTATSTFKASSTAPDNFHATEEEFQQFGKVLNSKSKGFSLQQLWNEVTLSFLINVTLLIYINKIIYKKK